MNTPLSVHAVSAGAGRRAVWQLLVAEILIGSVGVFVHESGQDPVTAVFYRCLFGALFLTVCGLVGGQLRGLWRERALLRDAIISGVLLVLNWVALFAGMARSSIGVATMVYHVFPFVMLLLAALLQGERTRRADLGWTLLAFVGVACSANPARLWQAADRGYLIGIALTLLAALLCGASLLMSRRISRERPLAVVTVQCWVGTFLLAGFSSSAALHPGPHWLWLAGLGVIHSGIVYVLFYSSYRHLHVATIAVLAFVYPLVTLLLDYLLYGHALVPVQWLGLALIVMGTLAVNLKWRWPRRVADSAPV
ncbi:drug/metabolite transporter (DMT)-like permease [Xanthomonas arboricola]|uniref:DMT family transporter n=1 Tax=Xanthomonas arboricola TaxID=56448 RepID=UPI00141A8EC4|nr:DMT family transporter [Xanthomonas arboricola]NIK31846.1 drug/metabolite transporter (DMT)-like permease [Xanthomonas arboricola]NJC03395.1 drug/metabolite transporter (DMT)-like permease [Xanthomonas arboricola]